MKSETAEQILTVVLETQTWVHSGDEGDHVVRYPDLWAVARHALKVGVGEPTLKSFFANLGEEDTDELLRVPDDDVTERVVVAIDEINEILQVAKDEVGDEILLDLLLEADALSQAERLRREADGAYDFDDALLIPALIQTLLGIGLDRGKITERLYKIYGNESWVRNQFLTDSLTEETLLGEPWVWDTLLDLRGKIDEVILA
jgi:hypothetical protein